MFNINIPIGVLVSKFCVADTKLAPCFSKLRQKS